MMSVSGDSKSTLAPIICALAPIFAPWRHPLPLLYPTLSPIIFLSSVSQHFRKHTFINISIHIYIHIYIYILMAWIEASHSTSSPEFPVMLLYKYISISLAELLGIPRDDVSSVAGTPCNDIS